MMEFQPRGLPVSTPEFLSGVQTHVGALGMDTCASVGGAKDPNYPAVPRTIPQEKECSFAEPPHHNTREALLVL